MKLIYQNRIALGFTSAALTAVACGMACFVFRLHARREADLAQKRADEIRHMYLMPSGDTAPAESATVAEPQAHRMDKREIGTEQAGACRLADSAT